MTTDQHAFTGWPTDAPAFLAAIADDNTAAFWAAHRDRYETAVLPPLRALAAALEPEFGPLRLLRPYRDRRFRPDIPPYRTDAGGVAVTSAGTESGVVLSATALSVRIGRYAFRGAALRNYRQAVAGEPGERLAAMLAELADDGLPLLGITELRGRPQGYPADHPRLGLLRLRALNVGRSWPVGEWLGTAEPLTRVVEAWRATRPLVAWLDTHAVG